ncbi:uncharacterized protein [Chelonus insularis]|uniref:uncharacterized protein n=1 Tax=Chelonus insularis TaxID=460826 RepID=UPI00158D83CB|nr:uncharacterized protein LOC118067498 [Chelonus insularis]
MSAPKPRGSASITLEMIRHAVESLQMRRSYVSLKMIAKYLLTHYPVERNFNFLELELKEQLDHAVSLGILSRTDMDTYCLSSFRTEAYNYKTDLSSFWERHYKKRPGRRLKPPPQKKKIDSNLSLDNSDDFSDFSDEYSDSDY